MKKILIIGCPGSGKSTFARALHEKTGLPLFYLDMMYWNADRTKVARPLFLERLQHALQQEEWIIDGNYKSTMEMRMQACDTIFFLDYSTEVCLAGIASRQGKPRADMPWIEKEGEIEEDFMDMIHNYRTDARPNVLRLLEKYKAKNIVVFRTREEAAAYLNRN